MRTSPLCPDTPLDEEAFKRGTSVYLMMAIPMLPHKLSNGICSLNEGEDRLALSCLMEIDSQGNVTGHEIAETVIRSDTQDDLHGGVNAIVDGYTIPGGRRIRQFPEMFLLMKELADILRKKRHARGSIDFDFPESKIVLDEKGKHLEIKLTREMRPPELSRISCFWPMRRWRTISGRNCPSSTNHDKPDEDQMKRLGTFINNFGYG